MSLVGRSVMLKTAFLNQAFSAKIVEEESGVGIWIDAVELVGKIQREASGVGSKAVPPEAQFLRGYPFLFVPFSQIQWFGGQQSLKR
jgi:hypothetical protein